MLRSRPVQFALAGLAITIGTACAQENFNAQEAICPKELPAQTHCYTGQDSNGAYYWIAIPDGWNNILVVHAHGGPSLNSPSPDDPVADLKRFAVTVDEGFAWAGSSYRHAGFGVRDAAADTDNLRRIFWAKFGRPKHTLLHGQSWGANVAAKTAEIYGAGASGKQIYDGVILTSGVLGGGTRSYDFRADLRAVYQYYCHNLPLSGTDPNSLWRWPAPDDKFTRKDLIARVQDCTGINAPAINRSQQQQRNLTNILGVIHIPERTLVSHMEWATFTFRDLVGRQLKGQNPFSNIGVVYAGSDDDALLNKGVERFAATQTAVDDLAFDADLSGKLVVPTLTLHAEDDPTAFVELENTYHDTVVQAASQDFLVQSFTDEHEHLKEATPEYAALLRAMVAWMEKGNKPTVQSLAAGCEVAQKTYGEACHFAPGFYPKPLMTRVYARIKPGPRRR